MKKATDIITINRSEITAFVEEGGKLLFRPKAERELLKLLTLKDMIEEAIEKVKEQIVASGTGISPHFKGVKGERITATLKEIGQKFNYKDARITKRFLKQISYWIVDSEKVAEYIKNHNKLPNGIYEQKRTKKLQFTLKS